jgi:tetratricopeptide (TPR) repeat protein
MGFRFRRTLKIAPGIRLNFNKNSWGVSVGPRGAKYTINTSGRRTMSVGIPGSGLSYSESVGGGRSKANQEYVETIGERPGVFAGRAEEAFYDFISLYLIGDSKFTFEEKKAKADEIKAAEPEIADYIDFVMLAPTANQSGQDALVIAERLYNLGAKLFDHKIVRKYFYQFKATIPIASGITLATDYRNDYLAYTYSEILQALGNPEKALEVIANTEETFYKDVAKVELLIAMKRFEEAVEETEDIENEDEISAVLLIFRAIALRELKEYEIAIETFKLALAKRSRGAEILTFGRFERACTYAEMGKKALAIKELNKILATDYDNQKAREKLNELQASSK